MCWERDEQLEAGRTLDWPEFDLLILSGTICTSHSLECYIVHHSECFWLLLHCFGQFVPRTLTFWGFLHPSRRHFVCGITLKGDSNAGHVKSLFALFFLSIFVATCEPMSYQDMISNIFSGPMCRCVECYLCSARCSPSLSTVLPGISIPSVSPAQCVLH